MTKNCSRSSDAVSVLAVAWEDGTAAAVVGVEGASRASNALSGA